MSSYSHFLAIRLPFPILLFADELQTFDTRRKQQLLSLGLEVPGLDGPDINRLIELRQHPPRLTIHDAAALVMTEVTDNALLLTGDAALRAVAEQDAGIEVHGILWIADQLETYGLVNREHLLQAYRKWRDDAFVRLPGDELRRRIRRLSSI